MSREKTPKQLDYESDKRKAEAAREEDALCASEIACAVADAWVPIKLSGLGMDRTLAAALDRLESVTRPSAMRKVRP